MKVAFRFKSYRVHVVSKSLSLWRMIDPSHEHVLHENSAGLSGRRHPPILYFVVSIGYVGIPQRISSKVPLFLQLGQVI
jgi:hypothetical protein